MQATNDEIFMQEALKEAREAYKKGEVPIGAVCVHNNKIISRGYNLIEKSNDASEHAEIIAIKKASKKLKNWRMSDTTLYVSVAPCFMCSGLILNSRIKKLVYGAENPHFSGLELLENKLEITSGVLGDVAKKLMQDFFAKRRGEQKC